MNAQALPPLPAAGDLLRLVTAPPMPRRLVLRMLMLSFSLMVLLVCGAGLLGYRDADSIRDSARDLIHSHLVNSHRGAILEASIEQHTEALLAELTWILGACFLLALAGSALTVWTTNRAFRRLEWQADELNRVSWHLLDTHEIVARRFSHEMHDELGQALTGLKGIVKRLDAASLESERGQMVELLDEVMGGMRELSQLLRPVILDDFGLDAGLRWLTDRFSQRTRIAVSYESTFNLRLAESLETHLFRITQEALTNIARHSGATEAWVRLTAAGVSLRLTVEDNGRGLNGNPPPVTPSLGMVGMRARARQVGGELHVENRKEGGLRLLVEAPLALPQDASSEENAHRPR